MLQITVTDDGRGVDPARLRDKVVRKGLATAEMAARLSEAELLEFLFLPGFSTKEAVTEISGRGVGLDVVQDMARTVGGVVRVSSKPGRGTRFTLQLPITMSVIRALLVKIAGEPYAFPLNRIDRIVQRPEGRGPPARRPPAFPRWTAISSAWSTRSRCSSCPKAARPATRCRSSS